ncbi:hypothetical protein A4E84_31605 [Streptomyces qaidamensis]|uniref:Uncharacterized protein n=1 Tax=Streptomyces qaidamensis TaxID=1783515 RepID=A0A143C8V9_9ACTN|nr:hypothetical protein A4E84_31605 [Streptomyces qaidamensis]
MEPAGGERSHRGRRARIRREERLDGDLVERDVPGRAEHRRGGQQREFAAHVGGAVLRLRERPRVHHHRARLR